MSDEKEEPTWIMLSLNVDVASFMLERNVPVADVPALEKLLDGFLDEVRAVVTKTESRLDGLYPKRNI